MALLRSPFSLFFSLSPFPGCRFTQPLAARYEEALQELEEQNREIARLVSNGSFRSSKRDQALRAIVERAVTVGEGGPDSKINRVHLRRLQHRYSVLLPDSVAAAFQEDAGEEESEAAAAAVREASYGLGVAGRRGSATQRQPLPAEFTAMYDKALDKQADGSRI